MEETVQPEARMHIGFLKEAEEGTCDIQTRDVWMGPGGQNQEQAESSERALGIASVQTPATRGFSPICLQSLSLFPPNSLPTPPPYLI